MAIYIKDTSKSILTKKEKTQLWSLTHAGGAFRDWLKYDYDQLIMVTYTQGNSIVGWACYHKALEWIGCYVTRGVRKQLIGSKCVMALLTRMATDGIEDVSYDCTARSFFKPLCDNSDVAGNEKCWV